MIKRLWCRCFGAKSKNTVQDEPKTEPAEEKPMISHSRKHTRQISIVEPNKKYGIFAASSTDCAIQG